MNKPLERESFTNLVNQFLRESAKEIEGQPNFTSHRYRQGFISQLCRDTSDIEFVRQVIGYARISTTSLYIENMSDKKRRNRINKIMSPKDLIVGEEIFYWSKAVYEEYI